MKKVFQTFFLSLSLILAFLVITFPYSRLSPKVRKELEKFLSQNMNIQARCTLDGMDYSFPLGIRFEKLQCIDSSQNLKVLDFGETTITTLPTFQKLSTDIGQGHLTFKTNAGFKSPPTSIVAQFEGVPIDKIMPALGGALSRVNYLIPKYIKAEGKVDGVIDWPLTQMQTKSGTIDLQFKNLKLPNQSQLESFGIRDLAFSKSNIKVQLNRGRLTFSDVAFIAQQVSGKIEGNLEIGEDIKKSLGNISLKWKVEKSDAVLKSPLGMAISSICPSPDSDGFCTRKYTRLSEMGITGF